MVGLVYTHNACSCNELIALKFRHQVKTMDWDFSESLYKTILFSIFNKLFGSYELKTRLDVVNQYKGRWKKRYYNAMVSLDRKPISRSDFFVNMFVKDDKETTYAEKAPRAIQYRNSRGALEMARFTQAFEHDVYQMKDSFGTYMFGKGVNMHDIAQDLFVKSTKFYQPAYICLDASKFDAHVSVDILKIVRDMYIALCRHKCESQYVKWLFRHTFVNYGFSRHGIRFKTRGTRMSGDMDTGLGNTIIMYTNIAILMYVSGVTKWSSTVNGDDSVLIVENSAVTSVLSNMGVFKKLGFDMKVDVYHDFNDIDYCKCKPLFTDYGWVMCREPKRVITRFGWSTKKMGKVALRKYLYTIGMCESAVSFGIPMLHAMARKSVVAAGKCDNLEVNRKKEKQMENQRFWLNKGNSVISIKTRENFYNLWGISITDQLKFEKSVSIQHNAIISDSTYQRFLYMF